MNTRDAIKDALEDIKIKNGGLLLPEDVVEAARPKGSLLHGKFEWDDTEAAKCHRIWQARQLITAVVTVLPQAPRETVKAFVSLTTDRKSDVDGKKGGYRATADVLSNVELRQQLRNDALKELQTFRSKYRMLSDLSNVFAVIEELIAVAIK